MKKSDIYATIGTTLFCAIVLAILLLFGLSIPREELEEGVLVSFGNYDEGGGDAAPAPLEHTTTAAAPAEATAQPVSQPSASNREQLVTQEDPSVAMAAERRRREQEQQRLAQEQQRQEAERQAAAEAAERERRAQVVANAANRAAGAFGKGGSGSSNANGGQGSGIGNTMQGNPLGHGNVGGHSWSLNGRNLSGTFYKPQYGKNVEGVVVVEIRVDKNGQVISTNIRAKGTTITDEGLRRAAREAAQKTHFTTGEGTAIGYITYSFVLN